jgi:hypothetical protein
MSIVFVSKILDAFKDDYIIEGQEQLDGMFKTFFEDGTVKSLEVYENGKKEGLNIYYFPSACVKSIKNFSQGNLNGESYFFSEEGDTVFIEHYENNRLLEKEVLKDSLYHYELNYLDHGMMIFNNNCRMCHSFKEDSLIQKATAILNQLDSTTLDCDYMFLFHQELTSQDSLIQLSDSINVLLKKEKLLPSLEDLDVLNKAFENEMNRPKLKFKRVKKIQKKVKVS